MLRLSGESNPGPPALQANTLCKKPFERHIELPFGISDCAAKNNFKALSRFMQKASNPPACSDLGLHVLKPRSFSPNRAPKMRESYQLFFGLRLVSKEFYHSAIQTKIELHFGGFFHQITVRQPIGRQDSIQTVIRASRRLDSFLHEAAQNFEVF
jgi:hypothetical protein